MERAATAVDRPGRCDQGEDDVEPAQIALALLAALERAVEQNRDKQAAAQKRSEREGVHRAALLLELNRLGDCAGDNPGGRESD